MNFWIGKVVILGFVMYGKALGFVECLGIDLVSSLKAKRSILEETGCRIF